MIPEIVKGIPRSLGLFVLPGRERPAKNALPRRRTWKSARSVLLILAAGIISIQSATLVIFDGFRPGLRDREYGCRLSSARTIIEKNPDRPPVILVGSSRIAEGVRPAEWELARPANPQSPDPLLLNMSLIGSGPLMELLIINRIYADGLQPALVLFEYWPPFFNVGGGKEELKGLARDRLYPVDRQIVRDYFPEGEQIAQEMQQERLNPIWGVRNRILLNTVPRWVPKAARVEWTWQEQDRWGWQPGINMAPGPTPERAAALKLTQDFYQPLLANYQLSPYTDSAFRAAVDIVRSHGSQVGLIYMPESSELRGWYSPPAERIAQEHFIELSRELGVKVINARTWMDDGVLADGVHLSRIGAAGFTQKLGRAISTTFPEIAK